MHQKTRHIDRHVMSHIPEGPPEMAMHFGRLDGHDRFVEKSSKSVTVSVFATILTDQRR